MIDTPASPALPRSVTVCLNGIDQTMQSWMRQCEPLLQFTHAKSTSIAAACYGDNYAPALATDYDFNSKHKIRTLLCLAEDCPESFVHLIQLHVQHVIFPGMPFDAEAFQLAITQKPNLPSATSPFFSMSKCEHPSLQHFPIKSADDFHTAVSSTAGYFREHHHSDNQSDAASLVVKEALTNAIYHSFRRNDSHERKYDPDTFAALEQSDQVTMTIAASSEWIIVRIADNAGALGPLLFANSLDRQASQRGLLDSRGRGFYLMRNLSDRMVVTLQRGESTAIELYFLKDRPPGTRMKKHFELFEL